MLKDVTSSFTRTRDDFFYYPALTVAQKKNFLALAERLQGKRIIHLNATAIGGGVAEILQSFIPYTRAFGIESRWYALDPAAAGQDFFAFTNRLHNALQGAPVEFSEIDWRRYEEVNKKIADSLAARRCDILVIHDPQPAASIKFLPDNIKAIYYSHIDTSKPMSVAWGRLLPFIQQYQAFIFSNKDFVNSDLPKGRMAVFPPAIDPFAPKQRIVSPKKARRYLVRYGVPDHCPLIVQVSRFDIWKNPIGVIEAFRLVQQHHQNARLALVGFNEAKDNPEAARVYRDIALIAKDDPNIFLFFDPKGINVGEFTVMAQNAADIIVQNSIKEGFGLTVTEAMWKEKPVIGGPASGIRLQIKNGKNGFIASSSQELADLILNLLRYPKKRARIGRAARASVIKQCLMPRLVYDHVKLYAKLLMT